MAIIHWIGIDDHADKWTIAQYRGTEEKPGKEFELVPPSQVQYLLTAALSGEIARGEMDEAVYLWNKFAQTAAKASIDLNLRVLFAQIAAAGRSNTKSPLK